MMDSNDLLRKKFELELSLAQAPMHHKEKLRILNNVLDEVERELEEGWDEDT